MNHDTGEILNGLGITARDYPEIMIDVENSGYFRHKEGLWQISQISLDGAQPSGNRHLLRRSSRTNNACEPSEILTVGV